MSPLPAPDPDRATTTVRLPDGRTLDVPAGPPLPGLARRRVRAEAFRQGNRGPTHEARIAYRDWGFDLSDVAVPTHIRLGAEDTFVSAAMGDHLERTIPDVHLHRVPGAGHFDLAGWDDILTACAKHHPGGSSD